MQMIDTYHDLLIISLIAMAAFCAVIAIGWPYLATDKLPARMRQVVDEGERTRLRERARLNNDRKHVLRRHEPKKLYAAIVDRFNLARDLESGATIHLLRKAGYRGRAPVIAFLAMRLLMPLAVLGVAAFYMFVVIQPEFPLLAQVALLLPISYVGYYLPGVYVKNKIAKRQKSIKRAWPDALDLLLICVESGMSSEHAFRKVADEVGGQSAELAEELTLTTAELSFLPDRRTAYENLGRRTDLEGVKSVMTGLMQSEQYGTPLGHALRVLAQENRSMRMSEADKKAAALSPKLTVPMILFFLPVLFAVIITPAVIQIMNS